MLHCILLAIFVALLFVVALVGAVCSSASAGNTFTMGTGEILSDTDGAGSNPFGKTDDCFWFIQCPAGFTNYIFLDFYSKLVYSRKTTLKFRSPGADVSTSVPFSSSNDYHATYLHRGGMAEIHFEANDDSYVLGGFTLRYRCSFDRCSSASPRTFDAEVTGTFGTDLDMAGSNVYTAPEEDCSWAIRCPEGTSFVAFALNLNIPSGSRLTFEDPQQQLTFRSFSGYAFDRNYTVLQKASAVVVNYSQTANSILRGFTARFACSPDQCSSVDSPSGSTYRDSSGQIRSDSGGVSNFFSTENFENCSWKIVCPPPKQRNVFFRFDLNNLGTTISLSANTTWGNKSVCDVVEGGAKSAWFVVSRNTTELQVEATTRARSAGYTIDYYCSADMCSSPNETTRKYSGDGGGGTIVTNIDSAGGMAGSIPGEVCDWVLNCISPDRSILLHMAGQRGPSPITVTPTASRQQLPQLIFSDLGFADAMTLASEINVSFRPQTPSSTGYAIQYSCIETRCSLSNKTLVASQGVIKFLSYPANSYCTWEIICPYPFDNYIMLSAESSLNRRSQLNFITPLSHFSIPSGWTQRFSQLVDYASEATLELRGNGFADMGATVYFRCSHNKCSSPSPSLIVATNGTIQSDTDGSEIIFGNVAGEECSWNIVCPSEGGYHFISFFVRSQSSSFGFSYNISIIDEQGRTLRENSNTDPMTDSQFFVNKTNVTVHFISSFFVSGFAIDFRCTQLKCLSQQDPFQNASFGRISSGATDSLMSLSEEQCKWQIQCPSHSHKYIIFYLSKRVGAVGETPPIVTISSNGTTVYSFLESGSTEAGFLLRGAEATVSYLAGESGAQFVEVAYTCAAVPCSSPDGTGRISSANGTILSDPDGQFSSFRNVPGEECFWTLKCANNIAMTLLLQGALYSTTVSSPALQVFDVTNPTLVTRIAVFTADKVDQRVTVPQNHTANITLFPKRLVGGGLSVTYYCGRCFSNTTGPFNFSKRSGRILSDQDGVGYKYRYDSNDQCVWTIECPNPSVAVLLELNYSIISGTSLNYGPPSSPKSLSWSLPRERYYFRGTMAEIALQANGKIGNGFTLDYWCASESASPNSSDVAFTAMKGTLLSDEDGPSASFVTTTALRWRIQCPTNHSLQFTLTTYHDLNGQLKFYSGSTLLYSVSSVSANEKQFLVTLPKGSINVSFVPTFNLVAEGFALQYECFNVGCDASHPKSVKASYGTIVSKTECAWNIQCSSSFHRYIIVNLPSKDFLAPDKIDFFDESGEMVKSIEASYTNVKGYAFLYRSNSQQAASLQFLYHAKTNYRSEFCLEFQCSSDPCSAPAPEFTSATTLSIVSDRDGSGNVFFNAPGEKCTWNVACPGAHTIGATLTGSVSNYITITNYYTGVTKRIYSSTSFDVDGPEVEIKYNPTTVEIGWKLVIDCGSTLYTIEPTSAPDTSSNSSVNISGVAIGLISVGVAVVVLVAILAIWMCKRSHKEQRQQQPVTGEVLGVPESVEMSPRAAGDFSPSLVYAVPAPDDSTAKGAAPIPPPPPPSHPPQLLPAPLGEFTPVREQSRDHSLQATEREPEMLAPPPGYGGIELDEMEMAFDEAPRSVTP